MATLMKKDVFIGVCTYWAFIARYWNTRDETRQNPNRKALEWNYLYTPQRNRLWSNVAKDKKFEIKI